MAGRGPRLAVRGILMRQGRLLLVNAYPGSARLWCAPGGGVEAHASLPDNLAREVFEETGLTVEVGAPCLVNEFHDPDGPMHQVDIYFRCTVVAGDPDGDWTDPEGVVTLRRWITRDEMAALAVKPDSLAAVAWGESDAPLYDPLEPVVR
ncbi:NUDIX domain-containing protein [Wenxinia marina]|uniref:ADP-ribose pyrophosphatase n=1 Tax=Wenxinia marina DSM 24838 TaxID=1123501 RepID=A0A0D0Q576_9RHOB|nr:NUDIX hydrolase [Wenxinia marina]KIQ69654.1 ADP-ribose pyrophosphatase [Wenxinia marina DSM 24838]GGL60070.1 NUDIX hydrolase [Wenxinia marina]